MLSDEELMNLAIEMARKTSHATRPNPRVGAALVTPSGVRIVAAHERAGEAHAEINVLRKAEEFSLDLSGARLAITLEPCSHYGKTPPCVDALLRTPIDHFLVGHPDPNPRVAGRGIQKLIDSGRRVDVGVLQESCRELNHVWLWCQLQQRPYVILKTATSPSGKMLRSGSSPWITHESSREHAQVLRHWASVIVTSAKTLRTDRPQMTARPFREAQPDLWVLGWGLPESLDPNWADSVARAGRRVQYRSLQGQDLDSVVASLFEAGLYWVVVEAGPQHSQMWLESGHVCEHWDYRTSTEPQDATGPCVDSDPQHMELIHENTFAWGDRLRIWKKFDVNVNNLRKTASAVEF
jgi:riboflavin biosynthesis protein RibD